LADFRNGTPLYRFFRKEFHLQLNCGQRREVARAIAEALIVPDTVSSHH
jgi:hypothetical protein